VFGNFIDFFAPGDVIDLPGLRFHTHAKATYDSGTGDLAVKSGHVTDHLTLIIPLELTFRAKDDGHGGTKIVPVAPPAKPAGHTALAETSNSDAHRAGHAVDHADSFQFTYLAGFAGLDRAWTPGFHLGGDHHEAAPSARGDATAAWSEAAHLDASHHAFALSGHDFIL
jgi:hypothetical protein